MSFELQILWYRNTTLLQSLVRSDYKVLLHIQGRILLALLFFHISFIFFQISKLLGICRRNRKISSPIFRRKNHEFQNHGRWKKLPRECGLRKDIKRVQNRGFISNFQLLQQNLLIPPDPSAKLFCVQFDKRLT